MKSWKLEKEIKKSLVEVIESRRVNWEDEMLKNGPKDLLGLMIQASIKEEKESYDSPITVYDIVEECKSFFFAGEQTTSNLLTWTTVLLAMHPQWQVMARDEVLEVCGSHDPPTKDNVSKLKMVILEWFPHSSSNLQGIKLLYLFLFISHDSSLNIRYFVFPSFYEC